jgi:hypothetical protein
MQQSSSAEKFANAEWDHAFGSATYLNVEPDALEHVHYVRLALDYSHSNVECETTY